MVEVGKKIIKILKEKGISVNSFAIQMGYTRQGLSVALKSGDFKISVLKKIADLLNVNICEFFQGLEVNNFEKELRYFIQNFNPVFYSNANKRIHYETLFNSDKTALFHNDDFMETAIKNIYIDYVFNVSVTYLNEKYNTDIKIINVDGGDPFGSNETTITYSVNKGFESVEVPHHTHIEDVFRKIYKSIDDEDVRFVKSQTLNVNKAFLEFIKNSVFVDWYKKTFDIEDLLIQSIFMDLYSLVPIVLDVE